MTSRLKGRSLIRPLNWLSGPRLALGCVVLFGLYLGSLYWVATLVATPDKSLMIGLLYRHDLQYVALVESLSRLDFSPTYSRHFVGDGIVVFPVVALLVHAVLFNLLGAAGFLIADILYSIAFFVAGYLLLRRFGIQSGLAVVALMLNTFLVLPELKSLTSQLSLPPPLTDPGDFALMTTPQRLPRPLVSAPLFLFVLVMLKFIWNSRGSDTYNWKIWGILSFIYAFLLQSNIYQFMGLSLPIGIVAMVAITTAAPEIRARAWRCLGGSLLLFVIFSTPYLVQIVAGSPSLGARAGIFEVAALSDRLLIATVFLLPHLSQNLFITGGVLVFVLFLLGQKARGDAVFLFIILVGYVASLFLYITCLPQQAQVYHYFRDDFWRDVVNFLGIMVLVQTLVDRLRARGTWVWFRAVAWVAASLSLVFAFAAYTDFVVEKVARRAAARPDLFPPAAPKRMRRDLAKVLSHLEHRSAAGDHLEDPMLLSNDNMVIAWWSLEGKGPLLLPDVFSVTLSQEAVERNLSQAGRVLGLNEEAFVSLLNDGAFNAIFHGHNQYQTSIIWHPAPLEDYPGEIQQDLMARDKDVWVNYVTTWRLVLPLSHQAYLREFYGDYVLDQRQLPDYVVIARNSNFPQDLRLPEGYELTLKNRNYRVWIRQK